MLRLGKKDGIVASQQELVLAGSTSEQTIVVIDMLIPYSVRLFSNYLTSF